jgi:hypothetical protein
MALTKVNSTLVDGTINTTAAGNVGIGTASPSFGNFSAQATGLEVKSANTYGVLRLGGAVGEFYLGSGGSATWVWNQLNEPMLFATNNAERMRIDTTGNLLVGKTATNTTVVGAEMWRNGLVGSTLAGTTSSTSTFEVYSSGAAAFRFFVGMNGTIYATSTSISAISDQSLKENIKDLETGLTEVMALKPRRFDWKNGDATNVAGFVAQEVEEVLPELVSDYMYNKDEDGNNITKKSLKMGDILPTLVKAIQEQQALINDLTTRLTALENK